MSILPIIKLNKFSLSKKDSPVRQVCDEVEDFGDGFQSFVDDLIETMKNEDITIGLAAPQVGVLKRVAVINLNKDKVEPTLVIVNPEIVTVSGKKDVKKESCMSLPDVRGDVERRYKMHLKFQDRFGEKKEEEFHGFDARVVAHEIDHMDGVLYADKMQDKSKLEKFDFSKFTRKP